MAEDRLRIVFVDDEQRILDGLRRQLHAHRDRWDMRFALSGAEALRMLAAQPADIVVSDMRMPGMTGGELLQEVHRLHPSTTRIILSGQTDQADLLRDLVCIHQYLQKPCEPPQLYNAIERTFTLSRRLHQPRLRLAANRVRGLPPGSESYHALIAELSKEDSSVAGAAQIVSRDPALTVKVMQLVNSAFFGIPRKISSAHDAVSLLGLKTLHAIVVAGRLFEIVDDPHADRARLARLWATSFQISESAARLARLDGASPAAQQHARLAGLLSLIGRAILMTADPTGHAEIVTASHKSGRTIDSCEQEAYGASQDDVTAYAMGLWAFSDELVEATAYQSAPSRLPLPRPRHPAGYVHLARHLLEAGACGEHIALDTEFVNSQGLGRLLCGARSHAA